MKFRWRFLSVGLLALIILGLPSLAASQTAIVNGVSYLVSSQKPDGSWGGDIFETESTPTTIAVLEALKALDQTGTPTYANAILWIGNQYLETTDYLSERICVHSIPGKDKDILLSYLDKLVIAWGGYDDYQVNNLDTALALLAPSASQGVPAALDTVPGHKLVLENHVMKVYRVSVDPKQSTGIRSRTLPWLRISVSQSTISIQEPGKNIQTLETKPGDYCWYEGPTTDSIENVGLTKYEAIEIELK